LWCAQEGEKEATPKKTAKQSKSKKDLKHETPTKRMVSEEFPSLKVQDKINSLLPDTVEY